MKIISRYLSYAIYAGVTIEIYTMVITHHRIYLYAHIIVIRWGFIFSYRIVYMYVVIMPINKHAY